MYNYIFLFRNESVLTQKIKSAYLKKIITLSEYHPAKLIEHVTFYG
jgi:hypothetical protein